MIFLTLILSMLTWAVWIAAVVWLGPKLGERFAPWFERTGDPQAHNAAVWAGSGIVALFAGAMLSLVWAAF